MCTVLHCTVLHCTALHCTALHCTSTLRTLQEGDQDAHTDEPIDRVRRFTRDEDVPLSTILAIMPGTCLRIRPLNGEWIIVTLEPGDLLIFRGDVCHNGLGYANENVRVHAYVYHPAYNPGASSLNACS